MAVGGAILIAPVYIAEISPPQLRGSMVSLNQLMIVLGISASFFSNYFLLNVGDNNWRWMLGMDAVPAVAVFLPAVCRAGKPALAVWQRADGAGQGDSDESLRRGSRWNRSCATSGKALRKKRLASGVGGLFSRKMSFVMFIALAIAFFQQITGINAIFYYLPTIFAQAGGGTNAAFKQAVLVGLVNLGMTFVAIRFVDRLGRKPLLVIGATGMAVSLLTCSWAFHDSSYQLTEKSFAVLQENKVPADLIADLKNSEKNVFRHGQGIHRRP